MCTSATRESSFGAPARWPSTSSGDGTVSESGTYDTDSGRNSGAVVYSRILSTLPFSGVSGAYEWESSAHGVGVAVVRIACARLWGHAVDRIGAGPVLVFCSFGIAAVPLTWFAVTPDRLWPIAVDAVFAAFLWSGHGIAAFDLTIGLAPRASRPIYVGTFAAAGGLGFGAASILAGQLAGVIPVHFELGGETWTNLHVLFLLSALGRLASAGLTLRLQDPRARGTVRELVAALADRLGVGAVRPYLPALVRIPRR